MEIADLTLHFSLTSSVLQTQRILYFCNKLLGPPVHLSCQRGWRRVRRRKLLFSKNDGAGL